MKSLGIDPSTFCGLACVSGTDPKWKDSKLLHFGKTVSGLRRVQSIARTTAEYIASHSPDVVVIEGLAFGNKNTLVTLTEIQTGIKLELLRLGLSWFEVPPTVLKTWTTGKGNADKAGMAVAVKDKWNFSSNSDDVVDAFALAQIGLVLKAGTDQNLLKKVNFAPG